jgi:hypothetical protein
MSSLTLGPFYRWREYFRVGEQFSFVHKTAHICSLPLH